MHSTSKLRWCYRHLPGILRHSEATTAALRGPASIAARHCFLISSGGCNTHLGHALFLFQRNSPDGPVNYLRASLEMELWFQEDSDCVYWRQSCNFTNKAAVDKCVLTKEGTMLMNGYGSSPVLLLPGGPGGSGHMGQKLMTILWEAVWDSGHKHSCYGTQVTKWGTEVGDASTSGGYYVYTLPS